MGSSGEEEDPAEGSLLKEEAQGRADQEIFRARSVGGSQESHPSPGGLEQRRRLLLPGHLVGGQDLGAQGAQGVHGRLPLRLSGDHRRKGAEVKGGSPPGEAAQLHPLVHHRHG